MSGITLAIQFFAHDIFRWIDNDTSPAKAFHRALGALSSEERLRLRDALLMVSAAVEAYDETFGNRE